MSLLPTSISSLGPHKMNKHLWSFTGKLETYCPGKDHRRSKAGQPGFPNAVPVSLQSPSFTQCLTQSPPKSPYSLICWTETLLTLPITNYPKYESSDPSTLPSSPISQTTSHPIPHVVIQTIISRPATSNQSIFRFSVSFPWVWDTTWVCSTGVPKATHPNYVC